MENRTETRQNGRLVAGLALLAIGLLLLLKQVVQGELIAVLFPLALGVVFLAWGAAARKVRLLVPGSVWVGLGAGSYLVTAQPFGPMQDQTMGGVFLLAFGLSWGLITLVSAVFIREVHWWPLIPGSIISSVGAALTAGGPAFDMLIAVSRLVPVALIILGLYLILWRRSLQA